MYKICDDDINQNEKSSDADYVQKTLVKRELLRSHKHKVKEKHNEKAETRTKVKLVNEIMKVKRSLNKKLVRQKSQFSF